MGGFQAFFFFVLIQYQDGTSIFNLLVEIAGFYNESSLGFSVTDEQKINDD